MIKHKNRNVILVVLDTHRFDRLGAYGYTRPTSPNLDDFASESVFFNRAIAPGQWTIPSHASMFSGEVPAVHGTVDADDILPKEFKTLAARLSEMGIETTGFCNNPLVGILQNGFKRGFNNFYNYCGVVPSTPQKEKEDIWKPFCKLWAKYTQLLRQISYPIQNTFASPNEFFMAALKPFFVPLWTRTSNFKGQTERSINGTTAYVKEIAERHEGGHFVFLNLMETHLPYAPPDAFVRKFVPYFYETPEAHQFMHSFNRKAMQWLIPLLEPFRDIEAATLSDMYDAEVAYQDHLLERLISVLDTDYHRENSMVIFLADHGEMLGEHGYMGHGFGVYEELVRVPLFIRLPEVSRGNKVERLVSLTQVFYSVLDYFGVDSVSMPYADDVDIRTHSLLHLKDSEEVPANFLISEAYAPDNALRIINRHAPNLIEELNVDRTQWAVYQRDEKMIMVEGLSRMLYNLAGDASEGNPYQASERIDEFTRALDSYLELAAGRRQGATRSKFSLKDEVIKQRLRDLGYLE